MRALDLFAGTGWGIACRELGIEEYGVDNAPTVIATREANGMSTVFTDVWDGLHDEDMVPAHDLLIASPPCQTFSRAGRGAGRAALDDVLRLIADRAYYRVNDMRAFAAEHGDDRTALVLAPLAYAARFRPQHIVFEQVPTVLPVWEACAVELRAMGYSVWTGCLQAEQYGVPQTRRRAILIARRDGQEARPPVPTHSEFHQRTPRALDPGVAPWVSMAEALGWEDPAVVGFPRRADDWASESDDGLVRIGDVDYRGRDLRDSDLPAFGMTSKARSWNRWLEVPAPTVAGDPRLNVTRGCKHPQVGCCTANADGSLSKRQFDGDRVIRLSLEEAAKLQTYPEGFRWVGTRTATFVQIGNAVPPLLAQRVLEAAIA